MGVFHQVANASTAFAFIVVLVLSSQKFVASRSLKMDASHVRSVTLPL
jgi:hypothetical protein